MTKHSRFGHNSYSNPFMCPDTRQRGELLYLSVIGSRLKIWTVIGQNCPDQSGDGEWNKHDLLDVRELLP